MVKLHLEETTYESKLESISGLILKNEMKKFESSQRLETLTNSAVNEIPKLLKELSQQREQIDACKTLIDVSKRKLLSEHHKSALFDVLLKMDQVLDRMNQTKSCLKDADNWNTVEAEMEALFASKDLDKAAVRLIEAEKSLELLQNSSNFDDRSAILMTLKERFFDILKSGISICIDEGNYQDLPRLSSYFEALGKQDDVVDLYYEIKSLKIKEFWSDGSDFASFLKNLTSVISDAEVFLTATKADPRIGRLLFKVFNNLNPSIDDVLAKTESPNQIVLLNEIFKGCVLFGTSYTCINQSEDSWNYLLYHPFVAYQKNFKQLEEKYLNIALKSIINSPQDISKINEIFTILNDSVSRFETFTCGYANFSLSKLYDGFICSLISQLYVKALPYVSSGSYMDGWEEKPYIMQLSDSKEQEFHSYIEIVRQLVLFYNTLEQFMASVSKITVANLENYGCQAVVPFIKMLGKPKADNSKPESLYQCLNLISSWQNKVVQFLVQDALQLFDQIPQMSVWKKVKNEKFQFSLSPLPYITSIGEYILTIPQKFENYFSEPWINFGLKNLQELSPTDIETDGSEDDELYHLWISSAVRTIEAHLVTNILKIKELSISGKRQLLADMQYLRNVMSALEIEPGVKTSKVIELLKLDDVPSVAEQPTVESTWFSTAFKK
ncbi:Golgi transport complex subunit 7 [Boothiomyces sp. JEL0866]|nr:Golgi transport complex subunit 7 [Boothiomyces sp. JEL0866]